MPDRHSLSRRDFVKTVGVAGAAAWAADALAAQDKKLVTLAVLGAAHMHTPMFLQILQSREDVKVAYVWDHDAARAEKHAATCGAKIAQSAAEILGDAAVAGVVVLAETSQLQSVVATAPRVWLVTDAFRLATRYENDFQQLVIEQFDPVFSERGVIALLAQGWRAPPAYTTATTAPQPFGRLNLVGWQATAAQAGQPLAVVLHWQATAAVDSQLNSSLRLVAPDGRMVAQQDGPPARGILPTYLFLDTVLPDPKTLELPASLPAGRYRLEVVVYDVASGRVEAGPSTIGELDLTPQPDTTHDGVGLADPTGAATTHQKERRHAVQKAAVSAAG